MYFPFWLKMSCLGSLALPAGALLVSRYGFVRWPSCVVAERPAGLPLAVFAVSAVGRWSRALLRESPGLRGALRSARAGWRGVLRPPLAFALPTAAATRALSAARRSAADSGFCILEEASWRGPSPPDCAFRSIAGVGVGPNSRSRQSRAAPRRTAI
ncbi:hypothetical protein VTG60DRAFT_5382 [Thermothelomyces hinnuleus]